MSESDESNMPPFIGLARHVPLEIANQAINAAVADALSEVSTQKPDWDEACEAMRWLNDIEAMQGGRNGPTIKLRAAIKAMQTEAANALYMVRADKAQALMEAEKAMAQIREATAKVVKERDEARAEAAALKADAERYRLLRRGQHWSVINGIGDTLRADKLDAAIDAARKESGNG